MMTDVGEAARGLAFLALGTLAAVVAGWYFGWPRIRASFERWRTNPARVRSDLRFVALLGALLVGAVTLNLTMHALVAPLFGHATATIR
ncbi:hypothetical protein EPN42_10845 [bacterium]|nr:MAG: hypothetical protein EPN42_10845 [bacterium]